MYPCAVGETLHSNPICNYYRYFTCVYHSVNNHDMDKG